MVYCLFYHFVMATNPLRALVASENQLSHTYKTKAAFSYKYCKISVINTKINAKGKNVASCILTQLKAIIRTFYIACHTKRSEIHAKQPSSKSGAAIKSLGRNSGNA